MSLREVDDHPPPGRCWTLSWPAAIIDWNRAITSFVDPVPLPNLTLDRGTASARRSRSVLRLLALLAQLGDSGGIARWRS